MKPVSAAKGSSPATASLADEQRDQVSQLASRLGLGLCLLLGAHVVLTVVSPTVENFALGILGATLAVVMGVSFLFARRGKVKPAGATICIVLFGASLGAQALMPFAAPIVALLPIAAVAIVLPVMGPRSSNALAVGAMLTIVALRIMYEAANLASGPLIGNVAAVMATVMLSGITLNMLTSFRSWTQSALDRAGAAAEDLRRSKEELEIRVQARTRELAEELEHSREITDRLHLLESVALNVRDAILILEAQPNTGPGRNILFVNAAFTRLTGYAVADAVGKNLRLLRSPSTSAAELERVRHAMDMGVAVSVEVRNQRRDGTEFWADQSVVPVYGTDGGLLHWVVVMRDVTHERAMRESLSNRNQFLEALHEAALGLMNRLDRRDVLGRILERACHVVGTEHGLIDLVTPGDDEHLETVVATGIFSGLAHISTRRGEGGLGRVIETGQRVVIEDYRTWSGRLTDPPLDILTCGAGVPLIASGVVVGALGVAFSEQDRVIGPDVLELLERFGALAAVAVDNARLIEDARMERDLARQITHSMGQGLAVIGSDGTLAYVNPTLGQWLGAVNVESLIGTRAESLFVDAGGDAHGMPAPVLDRGERMTFERRMRRADGEEWVAMVSLTPRMRANAPDGMVAVFTDLTAIKQTATALELARDRAQDASRLKSEFLAMMSHEIRTPLNAILGMNELLLDTPLDAKQRELAQIAFDSSQALMSVINDVLDFSRIEAGKLELGREPLNISDTVSKAADMLRRKAEEKALFLDVRLDRHLPAMVIGDAGRLRQVLVNLIGNSLKFTQVGGVVVTADVIEWRSASIVVRFKVQDTGIGLSEAIRDRLFEPFTQGSSFMTRRHGGTGLGLAICRRIVELMNGEITADGAPGDGATFSFTAVFDVPASEQK